MAWPSECSAVQSEMFMVRPAIIEPAAMSARAAASVPSLVATTSERPIIRIASSAIASPIGVRHLATMPAIAWARASMPVLAVMDGGIDQVRRGSTRAYSARSRAFAMPDLVPLCRSEMTAPPET